MHIQTDVLILAVLLLLVSILYSSVGQAGASGYLAAMALLGITPEVMKPTALALNILVASIAVYQFNRAGSFSWRLFTPLAASAVPLAYLGGKLTIPAEIYNPIVGSVLIFAAWYTFHATNVQGHFTANYARVSVLIVIGAILGLLSGLTGIGGGILLSPILLYLGWSTPQIAAGVSAGFILVNSSAAILGVVSTSSHFHPALGLWAGVVMVGGLVGSLLGSRYFKASAIRLISVALLFIAGIKTLLF